MDTILQWDSDLSLAINQLHADWLDPIMVFWSQKWVWIPLYAVLLYQLFLRLKRSDFYRSMGLIAVLIALSDQTASAILKPMFERLRPCHDPLLKSLLHLPDGCGGQFGFYLGAHFVGDVVVGFAIGGFYAWLSFQVWSKWCFNQSLKP